MPDTIPCRVILDVSIYDPAGTASTSMKPREPFSIPTHGLIGDPCEPTAIISMTFRVSRGNLHGLSLHGLSWERRKSIGTRDIKEIMPDGTRGDPREPAPEVTQRISTRTPGHQRWIRASPWSSRDHS